MMAGSLQRLAGDPVRRRNNKRCEFGPSEPLSPADARTVAGDTKRRSPRYTHALAVGGPKMWGGSKAFPEGLRLDAGSPETDR
ncbi:hypothetical protein AAFF_G00270890 [Aldrovandia affinis]|uniref:Uncharacterized protein n=1 Tax=Aldrovandia affinis TaxID=143900 RepID=A0AAD7RBL1_9TELE|nr:hypothetical protein AAFF_G00270890 [Aldrovandia affinis]